MNLSQLFTAFAALAPQGRVNTHNLAQSGVPFEYIDSWTGRLRRTPRLEQLAAYDALHRDERLLRRGWGFVVGEVPANGRYRPVRVPLLMQAVRLEADGRRWLRIREAGDIEVSPLVADPDVAASLEATFPPEVDQADVEIQREWLRRAAAAVGYDDADVVPHPPFHATTPVVVAKSALFFTKDPEARGASVAAELRRWAGLEPLTGTALAAVYDEAGHFDEAGDEDAEIRSPLALDPTQEATVRAARVRPLTVVTGAPGCGKSHTLAAIALDAVDRGESVLIATQSVHAADVVASLLLRRPGPVPVLFGDAEKREAFLTRLTSGASRGYDEDAVRRANQEADLAADTVTKLVAELTRALDLHHRATRAADHDPILLHEFPGLLTADLDAVRQLLEARTRAGVLGTVRRWLTDRTLRKLLRAPGPYDKVADLLELAADHQAAVRVAAGDVPDLTQLWRRLERADEKAAIAAGEALRHHAESADRRQGAALRAMTALATALRAGRYRRRELLASITPEALLHALPLWIGTVGDVADLLPAVPGMFDLVILDEASHIDQLRAAPVLARARRAVVAGDPRQLRFVSFVADRAIEEVLHQHGLGDRESLLDVRRNSAFDVAAAAAPVIRLSEHYRAVPHLIGFSARRFYGDSISTVTRHPRNDSLDAIEVHTVPDGRTESGVNRAEVAAATALVADLIADGIRDIAVITPYRAQADAIEEALVDQYRGELVDMNLRAGTVHAFQGSEADTVVISLALTPDDDAGRARFLRNPQLFNVMITRARRQLHVLTSWPDIDGLVGDFLAYAAQPPVPPPSGAVSDWAARLAQELRRAGVSVIEGYPVGRWSVDLCVGDGESALGVLCQVHPDGPAAHVTRHRILRRAGWRLVEAFPHPTNPDPARTVTDLLALLRATT